MICAWQEKYDFRRAFAANQASGRVVRVQIPIKSRLADAERGADFFDGEVLVAVH